MKYTLTTKALVYELVEDLRGKTEIRLNYWNFITDTLTVEFDGEIFEIIDEETSATKYITLNVHDVFYYFKKLKLSGYMYPQHLLNIMLEPYKEYVQHFDLMKHIQIKKNLKYISDLQ